MIAALSSRGVGVLLSAGSRFTPNLTRGINGVLRLHGIDDIRHGQVQSRELIRLQPQSHRVLSGAGNLDVGNPPDPGQGVVEIDIGVVRQEEGVPAGVRA